MILSMPYVVQTVILGFNNLPIRENTIERWSSLSFQDEILFDHMTLTYLIDIGLTKLHDTLNAFCS
jgi:ABC-type thiamine transport system ATPase subunit